MPRRRILVLQTAFAFEARRWRPFAGLRNSLGLMLAIGLGGLLGHTAWGVLSANGALNVAFPNMNSVPTRRIQVMLGVSIGTALLATLGVLVGQNTWLAAVVTALVATALTLYGAGGAVNTSVGIASVNTMIVLAGLKLPFSSALLSGALVFAGGLLQTFLLAVVWPLNPMWRERGSVAQVYASLSRLLSQAALIQSSVNQSPLPSILLPEAAALQEAWTVLGEAYRHDWQPAHASMRHALRVAEGVRAALVGYLQVDAQWRLSGGVYQQCAQQAATVLIHALQQVESSIRQGQPRLEESSAQQLQQLLGSVTQSLSADPTSRLATACEGESYTTSLLPWLELIQQLLKDLNEAPVRPIDDDETAPPVGVWETLKTVPRPSWAMPSTRHAVKFGLVLGLATLLTRLLEVPHGYWLVLTASVVLRQEYVTTLTRSIARLGGTLVGVLIAAALTWFFHPSHEQLSWWSLVGAFFTFALFPAGYAAFSMAVTVYVVFSIAASGLAEGVVVTQRLALTLLGGVLALGAYLLWPTWQSVGSRQALQNAAQAQREYLDILGLLQRYVSPYTLEMASRARANARQLRLQAEAIVQASVLEPRRSLNAAPNALDPELAQEFLARLNANAALSLSLHVRAGRGAGESEAELARAKEASKQLLSDLVQLPEPAEG